MPCTFLIVLSLSKVLPHPRHPLFENIFPLGYETERREGIVLPTRCTFDARSSEIPLIGLAGRRAPPSPLPPTSGPDKCILQRPEKIIPVYNSPFKGAAPALPHFSTLQLRARPRRAAASDPAPACSSKFAELARPIFIAPTSPN